LENITKFSKENLILNSISPLELWFFGKMLQSSKITLMMMPADPCQIAHHHPSNPPNYLLIIINNSNIGAYYSSFQGESDYQLCFSIGALILWQSAKKHQNCVDDDAADPCQIAHHQPSNPPNCLLIIINNTNIGVYYSVFQGEFDYQLCFSIGTLILWQSTKKHQNCVDDAADPCQIEPSNPSNYLLIIVINSRKRTYY
jgi:uncharacterized Tic20 family protein